MVAGGYVAAFLIASAVVAVRVATTNTPEVEQASSGMYAAGDAFLFVAVFGVAALVPTGAALFFLRPYRLFWAMISLMGLACREPRALRRQSSSPLAGLPHLPLSRHGPASPR